MSFVIVILSPARTHSPCVHFPTKVKDSCEWKLMELNYKNTTMFAIATESYITRFIMHYESALNSEIYMCSVQIANVLYATIWTFVFLQILRFIKLYRKVDGCYQLLIDRSEINWKFLRPYLELSAVCVCVPPKCYNFVISTRPGTLKQYYILVFLFETFPVYKLKILKTKRIHTC